MDAPPLGTVTDQLEGHLNLYDFSVREVEEAARAPDELQRLQIEDGPRIWLMMRGDPEDGGAMLVEGVENEYDDGMGLTHAYRLYEDLGPEEGSGRPFDWLRRVVEEFGLEIRVGSVEARLLFDRRVPIDEPLLEAVRYRGLPHGHTADAEFMVREIEEDGHRVAHCGLVYALDRTAYREYLQKYPAEA